MNENILIASSRAMRGAVARLLTREMARDPVFRALIRSVDDMAEVISLSVGRTRLEILVEDPVREAEALQAVCAELKRSSDLGELLERLLSNPGDTLIDPPTESVLHAAVLLSLWPHVEAGYGDLDRRSDLWVAVKSPGVPAELLRALRRAI